MMTMGTIQLHRHEGHNHQEVAAEAGNLTLQGGILHIVQAQLDAQLGKGHAHHKRGEEANDCEGNGDLGGVGNAVDCLVYGAVGSRLAGALAEAVRDQYAIDGVHAEQGAHH